MNEQAIRKTLEGAERGAGCRGAENGCHKICLSARLEKLKVFYTHKYRFLGFILITYKCRTQNYDQ